MWTQWLKRLKTQKKLIESEIGAIFSGITSRITTKNLKIGLWGNFALEPFLSFLAHFHLFLGWFGTPSSQYKVPLILVRDQQNLLRPFGQRWQWRWSQGQSPQICTVCHVWTFDFQLFQTLGTPLFKTNSNNGCPKRIYQHSGQAHKHFSHRFHGVLFLADVQTWHSKQKFVFIATNSPHYQTFVPKAPK